MEAINDVSIVFDNDLLEEFQIETACVSPIAPEVGVLVGSKLEGKYHIVSLFKLKRAEDPNQFFINGEVATFHFTTHSQQRQFIDVLPDMSAIDFIFLLNSSQVQTYN